jgi:anti-anti-sigma regulatory factor
VINLVLKYTEGQGLREFFIQNREVFEKDLLAEAVNVKDKIDEIQAIGNVDLLSNAHKLVLYIVDGREHEMASFAKEEGVSWAKYSLTLAFKLEWIQTIRRVLWDFLYQYDQLVGKETGRENFYSLEKRINDLVDHFLNYFFISYSKYKDELIRAQKELVDHLSITIIPITSSMCILPLIGTIDSDRASTLGEKVLTHIGLNKTEVLIIDLSGVVDMESEVIKHFMNILDGIQMMGCKSVITGFRPEIVKKMISLEISFEKKAVTKATLQQALVEYLSIQQNSTIR